TDQRKGLSPPLSRHADVCEAKGRIKADDGGWHRKEKRGRGAHDSRAGCCDGNISSSDGDCTGDEADKNRADCARAAVVGGEAPGNSGEERKGVDREREE